MFTKIHPKILYIFLLLIAYSIRANAHEFWIEPKQYQLNDDLINAHLRVGQEFQGMVLMYNPQVTTLSSTSVCSCSQISCGRHTQSHIVDCLNMKGLF